MSDDVPFSEPSKEFSSGKFTASTNSSDQVRNPSTSENSFRSSSSSSFRITKEEVNDMIITPITSTRRISQEYQSLTLDKLQFQNLELHGRDEAISTLKGCLNNTATTKQMVLVSGASGCGKSAFVQQTLKESLSKYALQVVGKFEMILQDKPCSGIQYACNALFQELQNRRQSLKSNNQESSWWTNLQNDLGASLGEEMLCDLYRLFPALQALMMGTETNTLSIENATTSVSTNGKNAFYFGICALFRILSQHLHPLVLVLDDLQWADPSSLEVIQRLLDDQGIRNGFMAIGIYRSNEVTGSLQKLLDHLSGPQPDFEMKEIPIGNLNVSGVQQLLQALLRVDDAMNASTLNLAKLCHSKTLGNPFYLIQFLKRLEETKLLKFQFGLMKWSYDLNDIRDMTQSEDNVVELLQQKMSHQLAEWIQRALILAAFLGCTFEERALALVWDAFRSPSKEEEEATEANPEDEDFIEALEICVQAGYIQSVGDATYSWVHDSIQQAGLSLVSEVDRPRMSGRVGEALWIKLKDSGSQLDDFVFIVATLINNDSTRTNEEIVDWAVVNLLAAKKAVQFAAFESAVNYIEAGIRHLPQTRWTSHYESTLEMYSLGAECHYCLGNMDKMEDMCSSILDQKARPIKDKLRAYNVLVNGRGNQYRHIEAAELCLDVLEQLGCHFPRNSFLIKTSLLTNILRIKTTLGSRTREELDSLPIMKDDMRVEQMKLLDKLTTHILFVNRSLLPLVTFRSLHYTLKYGICQYSPPAFASTAAILTGVLDDLYAGNIYANYALDLLKRIPNSRVVESRTLFVSYQFTLYTSNPIASCMKPALRAYEQGLRTGETDSAIYGITLYIGLAFAAGKPLMSVEADCRVYCAQMMKLQQETSVKRCQMLWQVILNLLGRSENPLVLCGEAMDEANFREIIEADTNKVNAWLSASLHIHRVLLLFYLGEYEACADMILEKGDYKADQLGTCLTVVECFHRSFSLFVAAQKTGLEKYAKPAKKAAAKIKNWLKQGNANVQHFDSLLDAEAAALSRKNDVARKHYGEAILFAVRGGYIQDAAVASERLAGFFERVLKDPEEASFRTKEAIKYYREWGAQNKADFLADKLLPT